MSHTTASDSPAASLVYIGTAGVFLGAGTATLFGRLLSVGLPDLRGALGLGFDEAAWMPTVYNMALMFMGPFSVYLGGLLGVRRVLLLAGPVFVAASLLLPFSPDSGVRFVLLVIAGLSSGTFYPLTLGYALRNLPLRFTVYAIGAYSVDILAATNVATLLEGWFVDQLSWRWIFWTGAVLTPPMLLCVYRAIPHPPARTGLKPDISWRGFLYGSLGLSLLYGALDQGERLGWLGSGTIVGLFVTGGFFLLATAVRRWWLPNPLVNLPFLLRGNTLILAAGLFSFRVTILAVALVIPAFLGAVRGFRPLETGPVLVWVVFPQFVMGGITAWLIGRLDGRLILATGFTVVAWACLLNARLTSAWAEDDFLAPQLVLAVGLSFVFVALVGLFVQQGLNSGIVTRPVDALTYSSFIHTVRLFGGIVGTAAMQRLISVREQFHSNALGLHLDSGNWLTNERMGLLSAGMSANAAGPDEARGQAIALLSGQVRQQAYTLAYGDAFLTIAWVCFGIVVLTACLKPMTTLPIQTGPKDGKAR